MQIKITFKDVLRFIPLLHNLRTIQKEDRDGLLYKMNYTGDYYALLPLLNGIFSAGCTVFTHKNPAGEQLLGRNFDLRHYAKNPETGEDEITGLITVLNVQNKKAKYRSVGVCDAIYLDPSCKIFSKGAFDKRDKNTLRALLLPFLTMDGVNEKGLAVSVLFLSTDNSFEEIEYKEPADFTAGEQKNLILLENAGEVPDKMNGRLTKNNILLNTADKKAWKVIKAQGTRQTDPGKENTMPTLLMRQMLDFCGTVDEAVDLAGKYNMVTLPDANYHIMVTDDKRSVMLEWIDNKLTVEDCVAAANFYNNRPDHYGYGYNRAETVRSAIDSHPAGITEEECMEAMQAASQNFLAGKDHSYTQWSAVYNLKQKTFKLAVHSDYEKIYSYALPEKGKKL